jgi:type IV secretory pathway TraG/TraD family ATPase VirD4
MQPAPLLFKEASVAMMRLTTSMFMNWYGRVGMSGRAFPRPLNYVVDEAGAVLTPEIIELLNKGGGLRMKMTLGTQSFYDYINALGKEMASVAFDNMNVKCYFAVNDDDSRQKIADSLSSIKRPNSTFGSSVIDMRGQVNHMAEEILLSGHISEIPRQVFLYQNAETRMLVRAPFLEDPQYAVEMPFLEGELESVEHFNRIMDEVSAW